MKTILFAVLGTLFIATCGSASVISLSASVPNQTAGDAAFLFNLTRFNTNLGTLTGVTLELDVTNAAAAVQVLNLTGSPLVYTGAFANIDFTLTGPDGTVVQAPLASGTFSGTAPLLLSSNQGGSVSGAFTTSVSNSNWANYEAVGVQTLALSTVFSNGFASGSASSPVGFFGFGSSGTAAGTAKVIYDYLPNAATPEPFTLALTGSALIGLGALRRRKVK